MHRVDEYLRRAGRADEQAYAATDLELKLQWSQLAAQWRLMAKQAEQLARLDTKPKP